MIRYVTKAEMLQLFGEPYFGYTNVSMATVWVRIDLPKWVRISVEAHERQHLDDANRWSQMSVLYREARAWWAGFKAQPIGFVLGILMSLTPSRIWLYARRVIKRF